MNDNSDTLGEKRPLTVFDSVPGGTTKYYPNENGKEIRRNVTITGARVDTHVNQEFDLQYYVEYQLPGSGSWHSLWEPLGKRFIAGNGATYPIDIRQDLQRGSRIRVRIENEEPNYAYDAAIIVGMDYGLMDTIMAKLTGLFD